MEQALLLITLGVLFLGGLLADKIGHLTRLPRVTMLLLLGVLVGQAGLNILPQSATDLFEPVSVVALTMVAFLLGGELTRENLTSNGRAILSISLSVVIGTTLAIWAGLTAFGLDPRLAMLRRSVETTADITASRFLHGQNAAVAGLGNMGSFPPFARTCSECLVWMAPA
jgi:NhaP-type Na+/H+ or K+/H+ antiporter